jgi:hypothetical protein
MYLRSTGNQSPKYEYKADAKSLFTCSLTKKKYKLSQIDEWYHTEGVQNFVRQGYSGKWFAKTQEIENPNKYDKSNLQMILSFIMIKPFKPQPSVDGMKPIAESMPRYKEMPMTEARPSAPDHAKTAGMSDFDDDLPPF